MTFVSKSVDSIDSQRFLVSRLLVGALCVAAADWLFYDRAIGLSFSIFLIVLALAIVFCNALSAAPIRIGAAVAALIAGLAPAVETLDFLSALFAVLGLTLFAMLIADVDLAEWRRRLWRGFIAPLMGPRLLLGDALRARPFFPGDGLGGDLARLTRRWAVPIGLLCVFLLLFAEANPLIEEALLLLDPINIWRAMDVYRAVFWAATLILIWPVFHLCDALRAPRQTIPRTRALGADPDSLLGARAIVNALLLFNALFAAQTLLDIAYLWGGLALPSGMTYASYAHRGAYPLLATALIAAAFAMIAARPGGPVETTPIIRPLTLAFVAQNVLLVVSSILRLDLYVAAYSLTTLRAAAFIWMGLVALGLALMIYQLLREKPLSWLIDMNALALVVTLYLTGFVNFPHVVASYNVAHSREIAGAGPLFDADYAALLGPNAIPAVDEFLRRHPEGATAERLRCLRRFMLRSMPAEDWRVWSVRAWRLRRYLASEDMSARADESDSSRSDCLPASYD